MTKRVLNLFLIFTFLLPNILSFEPAVLGENPDLVGNVLAEVSPNLKQGFKEVTLDYDTSLGVKVRADYSFKDGLSPISGNKPVKQLITLDNPTDRDVNLNLNVNHTINADTFFWDGKEYQATDQPQTFKAYKGKATVDPQDEVYDESLEGLPEEERNLLPNISVPSYLGTSISFKTEDGDTGIYDFSDVANLDHLVSVRKQGNKIFLILTLENIHVAAHSQTVIDPTYDMATASNYNLRYDGAAVNDWLAYGSLTTVDLDNDGKQDILVGAYYADNNSRTDSGSLYVIYNTLIDDYSGTGNNIDLATASNYNLRYDGVVANDKLTFYALTAADLDNDSKQDILVGAYYADNNSRTDSGSLYVIYNTLIDDYSGTGNNIDLATASNYNLRYDGAAAGDWLTFSSITTGDLDNDDRQDILLGAQKADNSRSNSGSLYVIYNTLIDDHSGTGNNIDLATSSNYNLRYDGAAVNDSLTDAGMITADLDNDNKQDILVGAGVADNNGRTKSGSLYIIYNTLIDDYSGTGNNIDLATSSNYNLRYDGAVAVDTLSHKAKATADLDNDGKQDLLVGTYQSDNNSRTNSGSFYVIYNTLIDDHSGTGNNIDLATSSNYNLRYDGAAVLDYLSSYGALTTTDFDNDGKQDILVGAYYASNNSRSNSGSFYIIYNTLIDDYSGTANNIDLAIPTNYSLRYDGAAALNVLSGAALTTTDFDNDSKQDILVGAFYASNNSRSNSGSLYVIYNFPHSISVDSVSSPTNSSSVTVTGSVSASNSVTNISGVQYQVDSNAIAGTWTACSAADGSFNSTSESFSCSLSGLSDGSHTAYIRTYDANTSYTASSAYGSASFTFDATSPGSGVISINSGASYTTEQTVTLNISATDVLSGVTQMMVAENSDLTGASWETYLTDRSYAFSPENGTRTVYIKFKDTAGNESGTYSDSVVFDDTDPNLFDLISPNDRETTSSERPIFKWKTASIPDATASLSEYKLDIDNGDGGDFTVGDIPPAQNIDLENTKYRVQYEGFDDSDNDNNYISIYTKSSSEWGSLDFQNGGKLKEGKRTWTVTAIDHAGNQKSVSRTLFVGLNANPGTDPAPSTTFSLTKIGTVEYDPQYSNYYYTGTQPTFSGTGTSGSTVTLTIDEQPLSTTVSSDGTWSLTPTPLSTGPHQVTLRSLGEGGPNLTLTVDPTTKSFPQIILDLIQELLSR